MPHVFDVNEEAFISFLQERSEFAKLCDMLCHIHGGRPKPKDLPETALVIRNDKDENNNLYLILYGDHTEAYRKLVPSLPACIQYFKDNINLIGHSSDTPPESYN